VTVEPENDDLLKRIDDVKAKRQSGLPTVPTTVALEKKTNPFIRFNEVKEALRLPDTTSDVDVFKTVRKMKDSF